MCNAIIVSAGKAAHLSMPFHDCIWSHLESAGKHCPAVPQEELQFRCDHIMAQVGYAPRIMRLSDGLTPPGPPAGGPAGSAFPPPPLPQLPQLPHQPVLALPPSSRTGAGPAASQGVAPYIAHLLDKEDTMHSQLAEAQDTLTAAQGAGDYLQNQLLVLQDAMRTARAAITPLAEQFC